MFLGWVRLWRGPLDQIHDVLDFPNRFSNFRFHRRHHVQGLMDATEMVVHAMQWRGSGFPPVRVSRLSRSPCSLSRTSPLDNENASM